MREMQAANDGNAVHEVHEDRARIQLGRLFANFADTHQPLRYRHLLARRRAFMVDRPGDRNTAFAPAVRNRVLASETHVQSKGRSCTFNRNLDHS